MVANLESNPHEDYYTYPRIDIKNGRIRMRIRRDGI